MMKDNFVSSIPAQRTGIVQVKTKKNFNDKNQLSSSNNSGEVDSNSCSNSNSEPKKDGKSVASDTSHRANKLPRYAQNILKEWFSDHLDDPYPTKEEKIMLASKTSLSLRQVSIYSLHNNFNPLQITNWFVNHRGRKWNEKKKGLKFSSQIKSKLMVEGINSRIIEQQDNILQQRTDYEHNKAKQIGWNNQYSYNLQNGQQNQNHFVPYNWLDQQQYLLNYNLAELSSHKSNSDPLTSNTVINQLNYSQQQQPKEAFE